MFFFFQFFHDTDETEVFMEEDLKKLENTFNLEPVNGDYNDAKRLLEELEVAHYNLKCMK